MTMSVTKSGQIMRAATVLVALPLATAMAQTQSPPLSPQSPPRESTPPASSRPTSPTVPAEKNAATPAATDNLVGLVAKSSDGTNLGKVQSVIMLPDRKTAVGLKVGSFLGFGGHIVAIPDDKFNRIGDTLQVNMTADAVNNLPAAKDQK